VKKAACFEKKQAAICSFMRYKASFAALYDSGIRLRES
jgi:hypothetical protein